MKNGKQKRMTTRDRQRAKAASAMPEVKRLVKRFGRAAVGNCLGKIAAWEREAKKLSKMRSEVAQLERRLRV
jgi:hypothetical protein